MIIIEMNFNNIYQNIILAYEKDDFDLFKENIDILKNNHKFLFMLLLEMGLHVYSKQCYMHLINLVSLDLSESELALLLIIHIAYPKLIFEIKNLNFKQHTELQLRLKSTDSIKYDNLLMGIVESELNFSDTDKSLNLIDEWLDIIEKLIYRPLFDEHNTKTYITYNENGNVVGKFTGVNFEQAGKKAFDAVNKNKPNRRKNKKIEK